MPKPFSGLSAADHRGLGPVQPRVNSLDYVNSNGDNNPSSPVRRTDLFFQTTECGGLLIYIYRSKQVTLFGCARFRRLQVWSVDTSASSMQWRGAGLSVELRNPETDRRFGVTDTGK